MLKIESLSGRRRPDAAGNFPCPPLPPRPLPQLFAIAGRRIGIEGRRNCSDSLGDDHACRFMAVATIANKVITPFGFERFFVEVFRSGAPDGSASRPPLASR